MPFLSHLMPVGLQETIARPYFLQLTSAIAYLHDHGISRSAHRLPCDEQMTHFPLVLIQLTMTSSLPISCSHTKIPLSLLTSGSRRDGISQIRTDAARQKSVDLLSALIRQVQHIFLSGARSAGEHRSTLIHWSVFMLFSVNITLTSHTTQRAIGKWHDERLSDVWALGVSAVTEEQVNQSN